MTTHDDGEILRSLGRIEGKLASLCERLDDHHTTLFGNGSPGLKTQVDRLDQQRQFGAKAFWVAVAAMVTAAGKWIASWFAGSSH